MRCHYPPDKEKQTVCEDRLLTECPTVRPVLSVLSPDRPLSTCSTQSLTHKHNTATVFHGQTESACMRPWVQYPVPKGEANSASIDKAGTVKHTLEGGQLGLPLLEKDQNFNKLKHKASHQVEKVSST